MRTEKLETGIEGLWCRQCEDILCQRLNYTRGIIKTEVSYWKGCAEILYDANIISEAQVKEALCRAGYPTTDKKARGRIYDLCSVIAIIVLYILLSVIRLPGIPKAENGVSYIGLFMIGLVTGTHCIVMCGGIMLSQTAHRQIEEGTKRWNMIQYHLGRVFMAAVLGLVFGSVGSMLIFDDKMKSMFYTLTGIYIICIGLSVWGLPGIRRVQAGLPSLCEVSAKYRKARQYGPLAAGIFTAIMPCAASNSMWMLAVSSGSGAKGAGMMLVWALGTVPCMILFGLLSSAVKNHHRMLMMRVNVIFMVTLGLKMLARGIMVIL